MGTIRVRTLKQEFLYMANAGQGDRSSNIDPEKISIPVNPSKVKTSF